MSDPVTNVQIEDVLSSIRRLVSEEARPRRPASAPAPTAGRLVLSPALRVPDQQPERAEDAATPPMVLTAPAAVPVENAAEDAVPQPPGALLLHDADRAEPEETLFDPAEDASDDFVAEEDRSEADPSEGPQADHLTAVADPAEASLAEAEPLEDLRAELAGWFDDRLDDDTGDVQRLDAILDGWAEDGEADSPAEVLAEDRDSEIERKIATLEQMLNRQSQSWTPVPEVADAVDDTLVDDTLVDDTLVDDTLVDDTPVDDTLVDEGVKDVPGAEEGVVTLLQAETDVAPDAAAAMGDTAEAGAPEIDIPAVTEAARATSIPEEADTVVEADAEPAVSHQAPEAADAPEADMAEGKPAFVRHPGRPGPSALEWEDHAPAAIPPHPQDDQGVAPAATAVTELSEEALHAMVAEIIREELQGVLGERITRNVRKLVRREIHRVLMSKDFD